MAPASSTIQVTTPGTVVDAAVRVNIDHNWTEDVDLTLAAPDGTTVELSTDNGGSGDDYVDTLFTDGATDSIINGTPPFTGSFQPEQPLSSVSSQTAAGDWTLHAVDDESGIDGKILGYDLFLCVTP
ncbi:MAG: proprotein convertase P-domain-containing protein [Myxococcaceae bacterium]|nr:proprotein convertase P-domain-containing protein [Myxococcaceae bacterium]